NPSPYGGGLNSYLRVFQVSVVGDDVTDVREIASNDNLHGLDAGLTFQAPPPQPGTGDFFVVGVSSFDNTAYDPQAGGGSGSSHGLFDLTLSKTASAPAPHLVASSFRVSQTSALWGDSLTVNYTVENRGAQATDPVSVSLLFSASNRFDASVSPVPPGMIPALAPGESATGSFTFD